jgi:hypothetical protein
MQCAINSISSTNDIQKRKTQPPEQQCGGTHLFAVRDKKKENDQIQTKEE